MPIAVTLVSIEELALLDERVWSFLTTDQQEIMVVLLVGDTRADPSRSGLRPVSGLHGGGSEPDGRRSARPDGHR